MCVSFVISCQKSETRSLWIASTAVFGALASALSLLKIEIPFPVLVYLKFDLAEIPSTCAFLLIGPSSGLAVATIHWSVLTARAWPPGALMKYLAVLAMLSGFWLGTKIGRSRTILRAIGLPRLLALCAVLGMACRVLAMAVANLAFFLVLFPGYLEFARTLLSASGIRCGSSIEALFWISLLTALFNAIHVPLDLLPSYALLRTLLKMRNFKAWIWDKAHS